MTVSFKTTTRERPLIKRVMERAKAFTSHSLELEMDLTACNANAVRLDFRRLLAFDDSSFLHDVMGIRQHLDRETGELQNEFRPRCEKITLSKLEKKFIQLPQN